LVSLNGCIADEDGKFDWTAPDEEFFSFINDLERPVGTYLYGRRLYELMAVWETDPAAAAQSPAAREFAEIWQSADKLVYSRTLQAASTTRTRIERDFDPEAVRHLPLRGLIDRRALRSCFQRRDPRTNRYRDGSGGAERQRRRRLLDAHQLLWVHGDGEA
jgi:hypothetical protein